MASHNRMLSKQRLPYKETIYFVVYEKGSLSLHSSLQQQIWLCKHARALVAREFRQIEILCGLVKWLVHIKKNRHKHTYLISSA